MSQEADNIVKWLKTGKVSPEELTKILQKNTNPLLDDNVVIDKKTTESNVLSTKQNLKNDGFNFNIETILASVGAVVTFIGVMVLIGLNWDKFSDNGKIFMTLGTGILLGLSSFFTQPLLKKTIYLNITQLLAFVFGMVGVGVWMTVYTPNISPALLVAMVAGLFATIYAVLDRVFKKGVLTFNGLNAAAISIYSGCGYVITKYLNEYPNDFKLISAVSVIIGVVYMIAANATWKSDRYFFKNLILNLGAFNVLYASFMVVIYTDYSENIIWKGSKVGEHLYVLLIIGAYALATKIRSKLLLVVSSLALFVWTMYMLNVRYKVSNNIGVGLIIGGFVLMGVGYLTYLLSKRFSK
jgi:hypothetical protein